ncbi:hypothetical protein [Lactiplantibacillus plantarum]|nr:hypothetical protein [Lactiplantibacillus plantarum]WND31620.1 hypothetical protein RI127_02580 [Lactiplantibacillus plantarum]
MELPVSVSKSDELTERLRTDRFIHNAMHEANKCRAAYYDQKIKDVPMDF